MSKTKITKKKEYQTEETQPTNVNVKSMVEEAQNKIEKKKAKKPAKVRGGRYLKAKTTIDSSKKYPIVQAVSLVKKTSICRFNGSVEAHFNVIKTGLKGEVKFPTSPNKAQKIRIADETLIKELEAGKIDFDLLVATPEIMPKLLKFAKLLGPKGLMPNPKTGTIGADPEKIITQMAGKTQFKTEPKAPIIHLVIGKMDWKEEDLCANYQALVQAVGVKNILKAVLCSTMGPAIKVDFNG